MLADTVTNFQLDQRHPHRRLAGQGNLVGITNLYSGTGGVCGAAPTVLFSYEVGTGTVRTSPSLSEDGTKVAYVESISGGSKFHVLTIGTTGSNGTTAISPAVPGTGNNAADTAITMNGSVQVTLSAPYIDYAHRCGIRRRRLGQAPQVHRRLQRFSRGGHLRRLAV